MGSGLIFVLSLAGLALLVFGERLGLPANIAALGVIGTLAFMALGLSLASTTSRLRTFLSTHAGSTIWGSASRGAMILILVLSLDITPAALDMPGILSFLLGFFGVMILVPPQIADETGTRADSTRMISILSALAALYFTLTLWPHVMRAVIEITSWNALSAGLVILVLAGLPALLGGLEGLMRLSTRFMLLCAGLCVLPFAIAWGTQLAPASSFAVLIEFLQDVMAQPISELSSVKPALLLSMGMPNHALIGALTGLSLGGNYASRPSCSHRILAPLYGLAIAGCFVGAAWLTRTHLELTLLPSLARMPPTEWPLFAFDPALHGWLNVCGRPPRDAVDIAQACGASAPPALSQLVLERQLAFPAVAASEGWPLLLGTVWSLSIPLLLVLGLGFLIHAAARGISENLLFQFLHPRALRAWRLAMARVVTLLLLGGLYFYPLANPWIDERLARTIALGILILLTATVLSTWLRIMINALVKRSGAYRKPLIA